MKSVMAPASRLQALFDLSAALSSTLELEEVLCLASRRAAELTGATSAELSLLDGDGETIVMLTDWAGNWAFKIGQEGYSEAGQTYSIHRFETIKRVLREQRPEQVRVADPAAEQELRDSIARYEINSSLMLPLVARGETIGLLEVIDTEDRIWEAFDVEFCMALCNVVSPAVRNALLFAEMRETALRDELTGLLNRRAFHAQMARHGGGQVALLLMDLDGLKRINDRNGHLAGDTALRACATAITAVVREGDLAFRVGGDEFAVILTGATPEDAIAVGRRIQQHLVEMAGGAYSLSGGVAFGSPVAGGDELYRLADSATYRAKAIGGGRTELAEAV